jgi:hypothetical protein
VTARRAEVTPTCETVRTLLETARRALAACSEGLDASAVHSDTPLAALIFDSLMAVKFIATLEADLGVVDLPFERWLEEHSERADALTVGSLVEWLRTFPEVGAGAIAERRRSA